MSSERKTESTSTSSTDPIKDIEGKLEEVRILINSANKKGLKFFSEAEDKKEWNLEKDFRSASVSLLFLLEIENEPEEKQALISMLLKCLNEAIRVDVEHKSDYQAMARDLEGFRPK